MKSEAGDDARRFGLVLDGYDVDYAGELADVAMFGADAMFLAVAEPPDLRPHMFNQRRASANRTFERRL